MRVVSSVDLMLNAADTDAAPDVRLEGIRGLLEEACSRPIPTPRWAVLKASIGAELARRAEVEGRSAQSVFESEIETAIALAAPRAKALAAATFAKVFADELRRLVGDLVLDALLSDWRHVTASVDALADMEAPDADPADAAHAERLLARVAALADLTAAELDAVHAKAAGEICTPAQRKALQRARARLREITDFTF